jgi:hypothetical protein
MPLADLCGAVNFHRALRGSKRYIYIHDCVCVCVCVCVYLHPAECCPLLICAAQSLPRGSSRYIHNIDAHTKMCVCVCVCIHIGVFPPPSLSICHPPLADTHMYTHTHTHTHTHSPPPLTHRRRHHRQLLPELHRYLVPVSSLTQT